MHTLHSKALPALFFLMGTVTFGSAQNATLLSDDHEGIVVRFDFSDPILNEVITADGVATRPRVLEDTPLLRAGAPDLSRLRRSSAPAFRPVRRCSEAPGP